MTLETYLSPALLERFQALDTPRSIQTYLDSTAYRAEYSNYCPARVLETNAAHCLDGAMFAAAALRRLGHRPRLVDMFPDPGMDDDHVLAVFRQNGAWGALAKSNFSGLRYREPVYATLRELVMSYFEPFYNLNGLRSLRTYTRPVDLTALDRREWETTEAGADAVEQLLLRRPRRPLLTPAQITALTPVDEITYKAGMIITDPKGVYVPKQ